MNNKYLLLLQAYQLRDHYALIIFAISAIVLFTMDQLKTWPRWRNIFLGYVLLAWLAITIYASLGGSL